MSVRFAKKTNRTDTDSLADKVPRREFPARNAAMLSHDRCDGFTADRMVLRGRKSRISSSVNEMNPNRS